MNLSVMLKFERSWKGSGKINPSSKGKMRYTYTVFGTKPELEAFKMFQGQFYRETEEGKPVFTSVKKLHKNKTKPWVIMSRTWKFTKM